MPRYNPYNRRRMSLNTVEFQPTVFTPIEFRPVEQDYSILERAMAKQEERKDKAISQQSLVKQALGKAREQLHQDENTLNWFDAKAKDIENNIQIAADLGDYASALQTGITAAGDIANDTELNARIRTNAQYNEEYERQRQRVGKGISQETFDWWVENNPYKYNNILDKNGNIIGGEDWKANFTPVDELDWGNIFVAAKQLNMPEKGSVSSSSNLDKTGDISDITRGGGKQYERMTPEVIANAAQKLIGDKWSALVQEFDVKMNQIKKLEEEINSLDPNSTERLLKEEQLNNLQLLLTGDNGVKLTNDRNGWITYFTRRVEQGLYSTNLSYNWEFKESSSIGTEHNSKSGSGSGYDAYNQPSPLVPTTTKAGYNNMPTSFAEAVNRAQNTSTDAINAFN